MNAIPTKNYALPTSAFLMISVLVATNQIKLLLVVPQDHKIAGLSVLWIGPHAMRRQCVVTLRG